MGVYFKTYQRRYDTHDFLTFCYSGYVVSVDLVHLRICQKFIGTACPRWSRSNVGRGHYNLVE